MGHQVTDRKALIKTLNAAFLRDELEDALRRHWSLHLLEVIRPEKNPRELKHDKEYVWRLLLEPVEAFIAGSDQPAEKFATLKKEDRFCNRRFCPGELIYSCRDCAVNSNCVLCIECFKQSAHKNHRYYELTGSATGYCDCGDLEAWKKDFACAEHQPRADLEDVNFNLEDARIRVPKDICKRFTEAIRHALCYVYQVLTFRDGVSIPPDLACLSPSEDSFPFVTILYDKVHNVDDHDKYGCRQCALHLNHLTTTLTPALKWTQEDASEYATVVDHEGRSPVKFGSEDKCQRVKKSVKRYLKRLEMYQKRQEPVRLDVVQTAAYAHQVFALEVLTWIEGLAEECEGFRALICDVCLQISPVRGDRQIVSAFLLEDVRLWKAARRGCYSLFTATFSIFNDAKTEFSRLLARLYPQLTTAFISDDHHYDDSYTYKLIVQLFPVPTVARTLFSDGLVEVILKSFVMFCQSRTNDQGRLSFDRATQPASAAQFQRALDMMRNAEKLLNTVPTSDQWTDALRKGVTGTFEQFLQIMVMMEGMDGHTRSTQSHVEYETDWKSAFNMQLNMGGTINLLQQWCASDDKVLSVCIEKLLTVALTSLDAVVMSHTGTSENIEKFLKTGKKEVAGFSFDCIEYDVSTQFVSIHHPVIRMLAGLVVPALAKRIVLEVPGGRVPIEEHLKLHVREILELPLRTMVLVAQARRGMWDRNGKALDNQIFHYQGPQLRGEMLDKDIVMMQACAAVMPPDSFLIALLDKFALIPWTDETFVATPIRAEDDSVRQVMCLAEDFLCGLNVLVGERFYLGVGRVTKEYCLKNEIIHQLCKDNMFYNELLEYLPDQKANSSLDELIKEVGVPEKSFFWGKGKDFDDVTEDDIYELKTELTERFNLFFYHYDEIERSKAKDTQRKRRNKTWEEVVFAPPCPPPFSDAFSRIVHLLDCNVFIHLLKLTVRRALINLPRFFFDDQLVRMLYLVGYALHEEKRQRLSNNNNEINHIDNFKFLEKAADAGVFMTLQELQVRSHNVTYKNLLEWVLHFYDDLRKQENMDTTEAPPVDSVGDAGDDDVEEKKSWSAVRRGQMKDAQIPFANLNASDLEEIALPDDAPSKYGMETIAIGIDFGAANVQVGRWIDGKFERITALPAFFGRKNGQDFFGQEAREMSVVDPADVIFDVTQFQGERHDKVEYGIYPFEICVVSNSSGLIKFQLSDGSTVPPLEVILCFLQHVRMQCEKLFGLQKFSLAFTVPSYWREWIPKHNKILENALCSGFTRVSLINSQVAATLGCYLGMKDSKTWIKNILIVDIGATDITATVSRTQLESDTGAEDGTEDETKNKTEDKTMTKTFTVTGIHLGCASVDRALMRYLKNQFIMQHKIPLETVIKKKSWHRLRMECEKARVRLSSALTTVLFVPNFAVGYDLHVELTRYTFDNVVGLTIAEDVVDITTQVLALSKINVELSTKDDFRLFLVGGGSRIPCIQQRMAAEFSSKISFAALEYCEDAAVYGAAGYARMIELEPNVVKLDIVQHYRDIYDFLKNHGKPEGGDGAARLTTCRSGCTHMYTVPAVAFFDRMTPIIPSMHGVPIKTDRVSYRFSIRSQISDWPTSFIGYDAQLHHIELTQATAASLQLQQRHISILSFNGKLEEGKLTSRKLEQEYLINGELKQRHWPETGVFGKIRFMTTHLISVRNPPNLCHPNVVRCLAVGYTMPGDEWQDGNWPRDKMERWMHMLLDMQLVSDRYPSSGLDITLHRFCKERDSALGNKEIINKTKQLLDGLSYLHSREISFILGNLTSSGILVTPDGETVKIWDILFGLLDKSPSELFIHATSYFTNDLLAYAHPDVSNYILEVIMGGYVNDDDDDDDYDDDDGDHEKCSTLTFQPYMDIWSLGCVVLDMVSGGHHFICIDRHGVLLDNRIRMQDFVRTMTEGGVPLIPSSVPDIIQQLCEMCFEHKPDLRTDALELLAMISRPAENEIDVCSRGEASFEQTSVSIFAVSKTMFFEFSYVSWLGRGSFGDVYMVEDPKNHTGESSDHNNFPEAVDYGWYNGKKLALKILRECKLKESMHKTLMCLNHKYVVKHISIGTISMIGGNMALPDPETGILMEYYAGGNLHRLAAEKELSATEILDYARQIASGLAYLHDRGRTWGDYKKPIIHGDLKGLNVFLTSEMTAKIGDIDNAAILEMGKTNKSGARIREGTLEHMSPEMLAFAVINKDVENTDEKDTEKDTNRSPTNIGRATDIWSLGCIILEMFGRGDVPYSNTDGSKLVIKSEKQFAKSVFFGGAYPDLSVTDTKGIQQGFRQLLQDCLQYKPRKRPEASHLLKALTKLQPKLILESHDTESSDDTKSSNDTESSDDTDT